MDIAQTTVTPTTEVDEYRRHTTLISMDRKTAAEVRRKVGE